MLKIFYFFTKKNVIKKDTIIPCTKVKTYGTISDNQTTVIIDIYQGEEIYTAKNRKIGEFELMGIPPAPAGKESVEVSISYDINGIINVDAVIMSSKKSASITIDTKGLKHDEIKRAKQRIDSEWK